jgi:hypothetical protein
MIPVFITTYTRPEWCYDLLLQLSEEDRVHNGIFRVMVLADHCDDDYSFAQNLCKHMGWRFDRVVERYGMQHYHLLLNRFASYMRFSDAPFFLFLQDDVTLTTAFWDKVKETMTTISDPNFGCLNLHIDAARLDGVKGGPQWTTVQPERFENYEKLGWFDMPGFVGSRAMFECVRFKVPRVESWTSSGVPCAWSRALVDAKLGMYRTGVSLVKHRVGPSAMHETTNAFLDKCSKTVLFEDDAL